MHYLALQLIHIFVFVYASKQNFHMYHETCITGEECQKNGTAFKPNRPRREKEEGMKKGRDEDVEEDEESDTDSLSDLYPGTFFGCL